MNKSHQIAREEYPGDQCHTAGWMPVAYDIFIPARQHSIPPDYWDKYKGSKLLFIAEYGDWEYYAQNAGFKQTEFKNLSPEERTSRQLRGHGEKRLLQQAMNFQEAYNDLLDAPAFGCANWLIFDYNRGYADDIEASGIMDIFRIPKFSYYFYKSQYNPDSGHTEKKFREPVVFIADYYDTGSDLVVKVYSNCEEVSLRINEKEIETRKADKNKYSENLTYPPFIFYLKQYEAGRLNAAGYINEKPAAEHSVCTPLTPEKLVLSDNLGRIKPSAGKKDVFFIYASIIDKNKTILHSIEAEIFFLIEGPGKLIGQNPVISEAGIASILVETTGETGILEIKAKNRDFQSDQHRIIVE
jgi:beta-galactosidase